MLGEQRAAGLHHTLPGLQAHPQVPGALLGIEGCRGEGEAPAHRQAAHHPPETGRTLCYSHMKLRSRMKGALQDSAPPPSPSVPDPP